MRTNQTTSTAPLAFARSLSLSLPLSNDPLWCDNRSFLSEIQQIVAHSQLFSVNQSSCKRCVRDSLNRSVLLEIPSGSVWESFTRTNRPLRFLPRSLDRPFIHWHNGTLNGGSGILHRGRTMRKTNLCHQRCQAHKRQQWRSRALIISSSASEQHNAPASPSELRLLRNEPHRTNRFLLRFVSCSMLDHPARPTP